MRRLDAESVELIIADPPYNKGVAKWDRFTLEEYVKFIRDCTSEFKRILSPHGNLFIYNQQPMASFMFQILFEELEFVDEIIWYYKNGGGGRRTKTCKNVHQLLYWFSKTNDYIVNLDDVRQPYSGTRAIYKHNVDKNPAKAWTPNDRGALPTNVWEISIVRQTETTSLAKLSIQKPIEICERILKIGSKSDSLVYIPFAGSGSEIVACQNLGRNWIATELNSEYINEVIIPRIS